MSVCGTSQSLRVRWASTHTYTHSEVAGVLTASPVELDRQRKDTSRLGL